MVGPSSFLKLSTKQDFANNMAEFPVQGLQAYRDLYSNRHNWLTVMEEVDQEFIDPITNETVNTKVSMPKKVESIEAGINDETHRVVMSGSLETPEFIQQEWVVDKNSLMFLKGFTEEELEKILGIS